MSNLLKTWKGLYTWERELGMQYYQFQKDRIRSMFPEGFPIKNAVAAFCVLSPNNHENGTYMALQVCRDIHFGKLPATAKVQAYGRNKAKAIACLGCASGVESLVSGRKVTAFFNNTMKPECNSHVTVDGHMKSVWMGQRLNMKFTGGVPPKLYAEIALGIGDVANSLKIPAPSFQASLWIGWRRMISAPGQYWLQLW